MTLQVKNLDEVKKLLNQFAERDSVEIQKKATGKAGSRMRVRVKSLVPTDTGQLKKSIVRKVRYNRQTNKYSVVVYSKNGFYATLLRGWRNASKRAKAHKVKQYPNWFDRAVTRYGSEVTELMTRELKKEIRVKAARLYTRSQMSALRRRRNGR